MFEGDTDIFIQKEPVGSRSAYEMFKPAFTCFSLIRYAMHMHLPLFELKDWDILWSFIIDLLALDGAILAR